ncbi:MAG: asparaginase [Acidimicrobiales bacterium]
MTAPLIVDVFRGGDVESRHEVDVVAVEPGGRILWSRGDGTRDVFARSALKPVQAVPLVSTGAGDAIGDERLAIACASHGGEPRHVAVVDAWLADIGFTVADLECGAHPPSHRPSADALAASGEPATARHNNCSGKHVGFLSVCRHLDIDPAGYLSPTHVLQADHLTPAIEACCGVSLADSVPGVDGCGIPVWSMPLDRLAAGWTSLGSLPEGRRILTAMTAEPFMVGGTDRACTRIIGDGDGRLVVKTGAEGVYCGIALDSGTAVALKVRDGATRASEMAIEWAMAELGACPPPPPQVLRNWIGTEVGSIRVVA